MAETKRQKLVTAMVTRMSAISIAHGYQTDVANVEDWRVQWNEDELPAIGVCDQTGEVQDHRFDDSQTAEVLPVQFRLFAKTAAELRTLIGDVVKAIGVDPRWKVMDPDSGLTTGLAYGSKQTKAGIIVDPQTFEVAGAAVEIDVTYITRTFDAYE